MKSEFRQTNPKSVSLTAKETVTRKLDQLTKIARQIVVARGHKNSSFVNNLKDKSAFYMCEKCDSDLTVSLLNPAGVEGSALTQCPQIK